MQQPFLIVRALMNEVMVSVVMPAYNSEKYIETAIRSVLVQKVCLELIVIDDGSSDDTVNIINRFKDDERLVVIINSHNMGAAKSRNAGVLKAKGKYIAFLDSDDYWEADKLEKQLELMESEAAVISSTGRRIIDCDGNPTGRYIGIPDRISYKQLLRGNVLNTSGVMIKREMAVKYPMEADNLHEDYITWLSVLKEGNTAYGIDEPLLNYRLMNNTKSGNKLKSARMTYGVYRYMGYNTLSSLFYFICYAINGVRKYTGKKQ